MGGGGGLARAPVVNVRTRLRRDLEGLRATHAELESAGFEGIDPKDMIFKQYRPEGGDAKGAGAAAATPARTSCEPMPCRRDAGPTPTKSRGLRGCRR